jgi:hypothetical protein
MYIVGIYTDMNQPDEIDNASAAWLDVVRRKVEAMRFGTVQIIVHEGRVTQVESTEKTRLAAPAPVLSRGRAKPGPRD